MTAPVTVTTADYALLQALDVAASADALLIAAFHRQQAASASNAQVAELREALGAAADRLERAAYIMSDERLTTLSGVFFGYADSARAKSASEAEGV